MNKLPTPTRDGDWQIKDGQLVDMNAQKPAEPAPPPPDSTTSPRPFGRARSNNKK